VSLNTLLAWLSKDDDFRSALALSDTGGSVVLPPGIWAPYVAGIVGRVDNSVTVVVCPTGRESDQLRDQLRTLVSTTTTVLDFPAWETLPHERLSPHAETVARRRSALRALRSAARKKKGGPLVVVAFD